MSWRFISAICVGLFLCVAFGGTAAAQECITCRSGKCGGMFWLESCGGGRPKPERKKPEKVARDVKPDDKPDAGHAATPAGQCSAEHPLRLEVDVPRDLHDGDRFGLRVRATCQAWVVVLFTEDSGPGGVLWPSELEPEPSAAEHRPLTLPSVKEAPIADKLAAVLRDPAVASREHLVLVGFARRDDFLRLRPGAGDTSPVKAYLSDLAGKTGALPAGTYTKLDASYVISPHKSSAQRKPR